VSPAEIVDRVGADAARTYVCFMGPPVKGGDWNDQGVDGVFNFLSRVWRLSREVDERTEASPSPHTPAGAAEEAGVGRELLAKVHWAIDKVTRDIEPRFQFNTAIAAVMELVNGIYKLKDDLYGDPAGEAVVRFATSTAASLIFPFAPHLGSDVYELLEGERVWEQPWPEADPALLEHDTFALVIQVNGKLRDRIETESSASDQELLAIARGSEKVQGHIDGKQVVKEIVVPGKLVNLVVR
jgi:leucyl-tRNA synthetase